MNTTKETFEEWLNRIAEVKKWNANGEGAEPELIDVYVSRIDGGYLCFGNLTEDLRWLYDGGITEQLQKKQPDGNVCCIGFRPEDQSWWGWSHRASCWFTVGTEIKKGMLGYVPVNADDFIEWAISFWTEDSHLEIAGIKDVTNERGDLGCQITWIYSDDVPNKKIRGTVGEQFMYYPKQWGRGEWKAETLDDAKQMAIDFAESVG